jgi:hypothetical protein
MQAAVRTYLTAGVATVGAGVIALSPIAPPMPTVHLPSVHQAEVQLAAAVDPIQAWVQVVQQAVANLNGLGQQLSADPAPILQQVVANQAADFALVGKAVQESIQGLNTALQALPATLQAAGKQLAAGQVVDATNTLLAPVLGDLVNILVQPIIDGFPAITNPMQNLTNFVAQIPNALVNLGTPLLNPIFSVLDAAAATVQTVIDSAPAAALNAIINAPATMTGALLNGFGPGPLGIGAGGLLTPLEGALGAFTAGPIGALIAIRDAFAKAIAPKQATQQAALKAAASPAALPAGGTTVTLSTGTASTAAPVVKTKATKASDSAASTTAADADSTGTTATTTPVKAKHTAADSSSAGSAGKTASGGGAHSASAQHAKAGKGGSGK